MNSSNTSIYNNNVCDVIVQWQTVTKDIFPSPSLLNSEILTARQ